MKFTCLKKIILTLLLSSSVLVNTANAGIIYYNDFEDGVAAGFTDFTTVVTAPNGLNYIGNLTLGNTPLLTLNDLELGSLITIDFDIYGLHSLDGVNYNDSFEFLKNGVSQLVDFYGHSSGIIIGPTNGQLVSHDSNAFGYGHFYGGASTYHYSISFRATSESVNFGFKANTDQGWTDEAFGLDNVVVTSIPEPFTLAIFSLGIMGLATRRFYKQP
jgi:hypothetical protein